MPPAALPRSHTIAHEPHAADREPGPHQDGAATFALLTSREAFDALEPEWNDLFSRAGHGTQVFQTFNWNWHWCNHYLAEDVRSPTLAIVTARRDGRLVMIWPMVQERAAGLTQLAWMGEPVSQYGDVLLEDEPGSAALLHEAWAFIVAELAPDLARLRKVRDDAVVAPLFTQSGALPTQRLDAPYLDISSAKDFATYEQRYSPRSRRNRRRLARRFEERGVMLIEREHEGPRARELATQALALKRDWLKDRGLVSPALADPRMTPFFADIAESVTHPVGCQVSALTSDGEAAAIEITVRCKDRTVMHVIVFNLKYEKAGAGVLLLEESIAKSFGNGCRVFDLLAPADGYKRDWADAVVGVTDWALPVSRKGWLYARLYLGLARPAVKSALGALPMSLRRTLAARLTR
jgi:CelD/BcsL family acetyltransferase involved in cellulose biosynthesis